MTGRYSGRVHADDIFRAIGRFSVKFRWVVVVLWIVAAGVIPKSSATKTVLQAAATVARGEVLNNLEWATAIDADRDFSKAQLGRREREILHLYASGLPLKLAAEQLGIGYSTAREYLDRIRVKYVEVGRPAPTKVDLLRRAVEDGILPGLDPDGGDVG